MEQGLGLGPQPRHQITSGDRLLIAAGMLCVAGIVQALRRPARAIS